MNNLDNYKIMNTFYGGMGQVFHLMDHSRQFELAMKQPLDKYMQTLDQKEMFMNECEKWMSLGVHPNIVQCYYVGEVDHKMSAFMEWMPNGTLKDAIKMGSIYRGDERNRLSFILDMALQIAIGLKYSHSKGVLHLDIKPANILLDDNNHAKISDFGISGYKNKESDTNIYTPLYCAPEQRANEELSEETDIYCYGVTLLHLICGDAVWYDGVTAGIAHNIILKKYSKIHIPSELQIVLDTCLQKNVFDRFSSFDEVIDLLEKCWNRIIGSLYELNPEFSDNNANSLNNLGVSYYNLGNISKAKNYWNEGYNKHPYHLPSNYNYRLYNYLNHQILYDAITNYNIDYVSERNDINYYHYLQSRFSVSTLAYEKAKLLASQVKNNAQNQPNKFYNQYISNFEYIQKKYNENGPKVLFEMNLKNILKVDLQQDCIYLGEIHTNHFIYVSKTGKLTFIDLKNKKINHGNSFMSFIQHATMTQNGQYLALSNDKQIYILDLHRNPIKIIIQYEKSYKNIKQLSFIKQSSTPILLIRTDEEIYDIEINDKNIIKENKNYTYLLNMYKKIINLEETYGGMICLFSTMHSLSYDIYTKEETSRIFTHHFNTLKENTMRCLNNTSYAFFLNNNHGYSVYDTLNKQFITEEQLENEISQFFLSYDGKRMITIEKDFIKIRRIPDYSIKEQPLWEINPFKTTEQITKEINLAKHKQKETYCLLNEKQLNKEKIKQNISFVRDTLKYPSYLELTALAASKLGFDCVQTRKQYTNCDFDYYPCIEGYIVDDNFDVLLSIDKINPYKCKLKNRNNKFLTEINVSYENIIGFSKNFYYLICKDNTKKFKYLLIELEWILDWSE